MKGQFYLKGLNCPNCARKIEQDILRLNGVTSSTIDIMSQKLTIIKNDIDDIYDDIKKVVHKYEPDVQVLPLNEQVNTTKLLFSLQGLTCPNCAAKIENDLKKLDTIELNSFNLMQQTVELTTNVSASDIQSTIESIVHRYEPDVVVEQKKSVQSGHTHADEENTDKEGYLVLFYSVVFAIALIAHYQHILSDQADFILFLVFYICLGWRVFIRAIQNCLHGSIFDENLLMTVSTIGAFAIGEYPEGCAVMLFYQIGEYFQDRAVNQSRKSIAELMDIRPDHALVLRNGREEQVHPSDVGIGETILVRAGEKIPLDGVVLDGTSTLDTSALTGESLPRTVSSGDAALSGCTNCTGVLTLRVKKSFGDSTASRILELVESASGRKSPTENFITTFSRWYTPVVIGLAVLLCVVPPVFFGYAWDEWVRRACVFLIVSCPCALVVSIPLTFFAGIGVASRGGILVKGSNYLEALSRLSAVVFDKTGTLTRGRFGIVSVQPAAGHTEKSLLECAAVVESVSTHPIAQAFNEVVPVNGVRPTEYQEIVGRGIVARVEGHRILVGNELLMQDEKIHFQRNTAFGTRVYVASDQEYMGSIVLADTVREDSRQTIEDLHALEIQKIAMLTGDETETAKDIAEKLGIETYHAKLLPDQKVEILEKYEQELVQGEKLAFVGDGINDAPVLARADVGIAMGGLGTDSAIEAADVVLMTDEPSKITRAVKIAKKTKRIVIQNIVFALSVKVSFLFLGAFGLIGLWLAVFGDVGVTILAILNALRMIYSKNESEYAR